MSPYYVVVALLFAQQARSAEICCPDLGCFTDDPPYSDQPLPWCIETMTPPPSFTMYTRDNRDNGEVFTHTDGAPSVFDPSRRTVFIAHGWQNSGSWPWLSEMKDAFLDREDINAVIVDWAGGADHPNYPQCAANTRTMGAYTALHFDTLVANGGSDTLMWCNGHSLGAHMCGHAGMRTTLERCTGMDPAGPWFESSLDRTVGINPTSGRFVDIMHTDTTYGARRDLGHIDFYPNGGQEQPGCEVGENVCSHNRAYAYFTESVTSDCFESTQRCTDYDNLPASCSSCTCGLNACAVMGYGADNACQSTGWFWVDVNADSPYCV